MTSHLTVHKVVPEKYAKYKLHQIDEFFALGRGRQIPDEGVDVPSLVRRHPERGLITWLPLTRT